MADRATPVQVANEFLELSRSRGGLSNLALQKLAYIAHGWHLALTGEPLVGESVAAWKFGPVFPSLYHRAKEHQDSRLTELLQTMKFLSADDGKLSFAFETPRLSADASTAKGAIQEVWEKYGELSPFQLVELTHAAGTPWAMVTDAARKQYGPDFWNVVRDLTIPDDIIQNHYLDLWRRRKSSG
jgi:uncharacterized phage-associated protein